MVIDIVMLTDDNYISQAKVTMYSVCKNISPETKIVFTILCDRDLNEISRERLIALESIFTNIKINFYEIPENDFVYAKTDYRVPRVSYYRLISAKVIKAEKAIFLDSDLIVQLDLTELYSIDIENYYIAGVKDLYLVLHPNLALWYAENYNINSFSDYINCGVLLMNLKRMRQDNVVEIFLNELKTRNLWLDQDIFNRVCSGKICLLEWRFNHVALYTKEEYEWNYRPNENKSAKEILHFCGDGKPWDNRYIEMADIWWDVAKEALEENIYYDLYRRASIGYGSEKISEIAEKCKSAKNIMIIGYSDHGTFVKNALLRYGISADIFFCDNNPKKRKLQLFDKKIYSPEEAAAKYRKATIWVNVVQKHREEIVEQLRKLEIRDEHIVNYLYE